MLRKAYKTSFTDTFTDTNYTRNKQELVKMSENDLTNDVHAVCVVSVFLHSQINRGRAKTDVERVMQSSMCKQSWP